eukprot:scaffold18339_cov62-Isochrysis_galbana.AAC.1
MSRAHPTPSHLLSGKPAAMRNAHRTSSARAERKPQAPDPRRGSDPAPGRTPQRYDSQPGWAPPQYSGRRPLRDSGRPPPRYSPPCGKSPMR